MDDVESGSSKASTDEDGLPIIDPITRAAWTAEMLVTLPTAEDLAETLVMIRWAAELERRGLFNKDLPEGLTAPEQCLRVILELLIRQHGFQNRMDLKPLLRLHAAIVDLADGISSNLFTPKKRKSGKPTGQTPAMIQGVAARTVTELTKAGESVENATRLAG